MVSHTINPNTTLLQQAIAHHQAGRLQQAEYICREIIKVEPENANACHLLGVIAHQAGRSDIAVQLISKAIEKDPGQHFYYSSFGNALKKQGKLDEAIKSYRMALTIKPEFAEAHSNLGNTFREQGNLDDAIKSYQTALSIKPDFAGAHSNLGNAFREQGKFRDAIKSCRMALSIKPDFAEAHNNLGEALREQGNLDDAVKSYRMALNIKPDFAGAHSNLGNALKEQGKLDDAVASYQRAIAIYHDFPDAYYNLGTVLQDQGKFEAAIEEYRKALRLNPDHEKARYNMRFLFSRLVPSWHFSMMNDSKRNEAYDRVIRKIVREDSLVLDIGTGSGLLSLMAVRAGAKQVITCEAVPLIAEKAKEIIRLNGFEKAITVLNKKSTSMKVGKDMPDRANILIAEIFDAGLLGEGAIQAIQHARTHLLTYDARILPKEAKVFAFLIESQELFEESHVEMASGFDLSLFNEFGFHRIQKPIQSFSYRSISDVFEVFSFDFAGELIRNEQMKIEINACTDGTCHAIVFWFRLHLDDEIFIDTGPQNEDTHWMQMVQFLKQPVKIKKNELITVFAKHNRNQISLEIK